MAPSTQKSKKERKGKIVMQEKSLSPIEDLRKRKFMALGMEAYDSEAASFLLDELEKNDKEIKKIADQEAGKKK